MRKVHAIRPLHMHAHAHAYARRGSEALLTLTPPTPTSFPTPTLTLSLTLHQILGAAQRLSQCMPSSVHLPSSHRPPHTALLTPPSSHHPPHTTLLIPPSSHRPPYTYPPHTTLLIPPSSYHPPHATLRIPPSSHRPPHTTLRMPPTLLSPSTQCTHGSVRSVPYICIWCRIYALAQALLADPVLSKHTDWVRVQARSRGSYSACMHGHIRVHAWPHSHACMATFACTHGHIRMHALSALIDPGCGCRRGQRPPILPTRRCSAKGSLWTG